MTNFLFFVLFCFILLSTRRQHSSPHHLPLAFSTLFQHPEFTLPFLTPFLTLHRANRTTRNDFFSFFSLFYLSHARWPIEIPLFLVFLLKHLRLTSHLSSFAWYIYSQTHTSFLSTRFFSLDIYPFSSEHVSQPPLLLQIYDAASFRFFLSFFLSFWVIDWAPACLWLYDGFALDYILSFSFSSFSSSIMRERLGGWTILMCFVLVFVVH